MVQNLGLGTAAIGRPQYINIRQGKVEEFNLHTFRQAGRNVLEAAYQQGIRYFDTAPGYGMAEQLLLDWVKEKNDQSVEIATKWGYTYVANFDPKATVHEVKDHSLSKLNEQWTKSKELLPFLNTLQVHSATFDTGVLKNEAVLNRLAELKSEYGVLMGITTTGDNQVEVIKNALDVTIENSFLFDTFQITYNILDQSLSEVSYLLNSSGKRIIIKEALANGRLFPNTNFLHYNDMYNTLNQMAKKYKVGVDAIALRFCMDSLPAFQVLSGGADSNHIKENLKSSDFKLEESELLKLKSFQISPKNYWSERKQLQWN